MIELCDTLEKTQTAQKEYACFKYGIHFKHNNMLPIYNNFHVVNPYECNKSKAFCHYPSLRQQEQTPSEKKYHVINVGKHSKEILILFCTRKVTWVYECNQCGKAFSQKTSVKVHVRTHTREKPYECNHCGKSFGTSYHIVHKRMHTGEKL